MNGIGVAAFLIDSFTGRGIIETITDPSRLANLSMIVDAFRALDLLSMHARIDASRIALMGFSRGGFVALYASLKRFRRMHGPDGVDFAAHIPFYAQCNTTYIGDEEVSDRPIRLFHGVVDDCVFPSSRVASMSIACVAPGKTSNSQSTPVHTMRSTIPTTRPHVFCLMR